MDRDFWLDRWHNRQIGFHQPGGHPMLRAHWNTLALARDARVLVPLCGKSVDMAWLAGCGHSVTGVELAAQAAHDFFAEQHMTPTVEAGGTFERHAAGTVEILVGDFLDLSAEALAAFDAVYDRASLIALPRADRLRHAEHLLAGLHRGVQMLLITLDYDSATMDGPPFAVADDEVRDLFARTCTVACLAERDGLVDSDHLRERGLDAATERVYRITRT